MIFVAGYEPAGPPVHPPKNNKKTMNRGVIFFLVSVLHAYPQNYFIWDEIDFA